MRGSHVVSCLARSYVDMAANVGSRPQSDVRIMNERLLAQGRQTGRSAPKSSKQSYLCVLTQPDRGL